MIPTPIIPALFTVPMGLLLLLAVALHLISNNQPDVPLSRRRIRQANAAVITITVPLLVIGSSFMDPSGHPREWMLVWLANMGLLLISIGLAMVDALNNIRLARRSRRALRVVLDLTAGRIRHERTRTGLVAAAGPGSSSIENPPRDA